MRKKQILESVLADLLAEIAGPLKESCTSAYSLIEKCSEEDTYKRIPKFVQDKVEPCQEAMEKYKRALEEVSRIGGSDESIDNKLKYIYDQIAGDIRNGAGALLAFADICDVESKTLPEEIRQMIEPAKAAWGKFMASDEKISERLRRLPPEKLEEYRHYHTRGKKK